MTRSFLLVGSLVGALAAGCAKTSDSNSTSTPAGSGASGSAQSSPQQQATQGAQQAAQGMAALAQGLQQMGQQMGQNANVKAVDYTLLKDLLPDVAGWEKTNAKGNQVSMGVSISTAEATYKKGDQSVKLEITDTSLSQMMIAPFTMMIAAGYEEKSDDGYKKAIKIGDTPGWEEWEKGSNHGEVNLLVANRFIVHADGNDVPSTDPARQIAQAVNLAKLASLK